MKDRKPQIFCDQWDKIQDHTFFFFFFLQMAWKMVLPLNIPGEDICLASCSTVCLYHWFQGMLWQNHEYGVIQLNVYLQICFLLLAVWLGCLGKDDTVQRIL